MPKANSRGGSMLLHIAERTLNRPLLIHPDKVPLILGILNGRIPLGDISEMRAAAEASIDSMPADAQRVMRGPSASRFVGSSADPESGDRLMYRRTPDGVAVITITGSLINRGAWLGSYSGETSYEGIKAQLDAALADQKVKGILLDIESPGGEAVGAMEASAAVRAANAKKPTYAIANGMATSAAYGLMSGAGRGFVTPTALTANVGVVLLHVDMSRQLDKEGITPTLIFAGAHKVDGNPLQPLPESVRQDLQREVNQHYDLFVQTVAAGRKNLSAAAIRASEARIYIGQEAVDAGFADAVGTFEEALSALSVSSARSRAFSTGAVMTANSGHQPGADNPGFTQVQLDAAVTAARAEGVTQGKAEGAKAERDRLTAILGDDKVKGKTGAALKLAGKMPDASAADVVDIVADMNAASPSGTIEQRMHGQGAALSLGPMQKPPGADADKPRLSPSAVYDRRAGACRETPARR